MYLLRALIGLTDCLPLLWMSSFQLSAESNFAIASVVHCYAFWLAKKFSRHLFNWIKDETNTNRDVLSRVFPCSAPAACFWFFWLVFWIFCARCELSFFHATKNILGRALVSSFQWFCKNIWRFTDQNSCKSRQVSFVRSIAFFYLIILGLWTLSTYFIGLLNIWVGIYFC